MTDLFVTNQLVKIIGSFGLSFSLALYLTPLIRQGAINYEILDTPTTPLKNHTQAVPYMGGTAVYLSFLITAALIFDFNAHLIGLLLGGTMITMVGLFDDLRVLPATFKLLIEVLIVWVVLKSDIQIQLISLPILVSIPLSALWLLGISNSINIIDVSDGLAAGTSAVAAFFLFLIAFFNGDTLITTLTIALCGSLLGFLHYNKEPASIYLGDTGSLFIGFTLASLSMIGAYTSHSIFGVITPIAILFVPIFDVTLCSIARLRKGISPLQGSPDHFALRLKSKGWSASRIARTTYVFGAFTGTLGLGITYSQPVVAGAIAGFVILLFLVLLITFLVAIPSPAPKQNTSPSPDQSTRSQSIKSSSPQRTSG